MAALTMGAMPSMRMPMIKLATRPINIPISRRSGKRSFLIVGLFAAVAVAPIWATASAHPEDDICGPDSGMDPVLCDALAGLERDGAVGAWTLESLASNAPSMGLFDALAAFFAAGWDHVLPSGLDHIFFIVALFLAAQTMLQRIGLVSVFTIAHTISVGLAAGGLIAPSPAIVEPLITLSIAAVAIETLVFKKPPPWRPGLVFCFGLLHGLGFANAFSLASSDGSVFWPGLLGFNLGVEAAQIVVGTGVLVVAAAAHRTIFTAPTPQTYRTWITVPVAVGLGAVGVVWTLMTLLAP
ncbi:MAG: HupE/UreJ family protein [Pseudomonadota bacterium]